MSSVHVRSINALSKNITAVEILMQSHLNGAQQTDDIAHVRIECDHARHGIGEHGIDASNLSTIYFNVRS